MNSHIRTSIPNNRLDFIDALRGCAAIYVTIFHMAKVPAFKPPIPDWIEPFILNGYSGVTLFFVISAFTLCYTLDGKINERNALRFYFIRRLCRILPLYYVWLLVSLFILYGYDFWPNIWYYKRELIAYLIFSYNFIPGMQEGVVWASWTLGVEMIFYIFFPLIFFYVRRTWQAVVLLGITFTLSLIHKYYTRNIDGYDYYTGILHQLPNFSVGIICYYFYKQIDALKQPVQQGRLLLAVSVLSWILIPYFVPRNIIIDRSYFMAFAYGGVIVGLSIVPIKLFVNKSWTFIGLLSYSLYLNHAQIIFYSGFIYANIYSWGYNQTFSFFTCFFITIIPLLAISYITYRLIERPGIRFGSSLIQRIKSKSVANYMKG